jgi:hypothetical protein
MFSNEEVNDPTDHDEEEVNPADIGADYYAANGAAWDGGYDD